MLDNIAVLSPSTSLELYENVRCLRKDLIKYPEVRVVILDSLSLPILYCADSWQRTKAFFYILKELRSLSQMNIAVIVTNELKNQYDNQKTNFQLVSAGGHVTSNRMHRRLMLARMNENKFGLRILKTPLRRMMSITFQITEEGIEDSFSDQTKKI